MGLFQEGHTQSKGRPKGAKNKLSIDIRQEFFEVYDGMGGHDAFQAWAQKHPKYFYQMFARMACNTLEVNLNQQEDFLESIAVQDAAAISQDQLQLMDTVNIIKPVNKVCIPILQAL